MSATLMVTPIPKPVCAWCQTEEERKSQPANQSHGICEPCSKKALADYFERKRGTHEN